MSMAGHFTRVYLDSKHKDAGELDEQNFVSYPYNLKPDHYPPKEKKKAEP